MAIISWIFCSAKNPSSLFKQRQRNSIEGTPFHHCVHKTKVWETLPEHVFSKTKLSFLQLSYRFGSQPTPQPESSKPHRWLWSPACSCIEILRDDYCNSKPRSQTIKLLLSTTRLRFLIGREFQPNFWKSFQNAAWLLFFLTGVPNNIYITIPRGLFWKG